MRGLSRAASRLAVHALVAIPLALAPPSVSPAFAAGPTDVMAPPQWVTTENGVMLQRQSDENTKIPEGNKAAKRVYEQALELANKATDQDEQRKDMFKLRNAEEKFTLLADELTPNFAYAYTNRANVRVALGNYMGAIRDYGRAIELAPLAKDTWVTLLNRGSTLLAIERPDLALPDLQKSVELSKGDRFTLLERGSAYHALNRYNDAIADYGAVLDKYPGNVEPWWLRYSLDLLEVDKRQEALGFARRLAAKFDIEPETNLAVCSLLWKDGTEVDRDEALRRWKVAPLTTKRQMLAFDVAKRQWPPSAVLASKDFRSAVPPPPPEVEAPAPAAAAPVELPPSTEAPVAPPPTEAPVAPPPTEAPVAASPSSGMDERAALMKERIRQLELELGKSPS